MTVKVIALVTRNENAPEAFAKYRTATAALFDSVGAKIVQVFEINEVIIGNRLAKTVFVAEYSDRAFLEYSVSLACE